MTAAERMLILVLRLFGGVMLLALPSALMPLRWMNVVHQELGLGDLPGAPIVEYLARSCSILYAMHGALVFFVSFDVRRYADVIRFLALAGFVFGVGMFWVDWTAQMPAFWTWSEGPIILAESALILVLLRRTAR
ncbi:MAG: hypothetical protein U1G07_11230 [Verrucomicrobiota bacterium]